MIGICLISFNDSKLELNPIGDMLAIVAAFVWAVYSLLTRKLATMDIIPFKQQGGYLHTELFLCSHSFLFWF